MQMVISRVNGMRIPIANSARGVIPRFYTQGDNELVFAKPTAAEAKAAQRAAQADEAPVDMSAPQPKATGESAASRRKKSFDLE